GVGDGKGNVEDAGKALGQKGFSASGGADHDDIALLQFHVIHFGGTVDPLVMVVNGHGQRLLGMVLPDDVLIEDIPDFLGFGQVAEVEVLFASQLLLDDLIAQLDALIADVNSR